MARHCPDCKSSLAPKSFYGMTVDACPQCAGIFFDEGEINRVRAAGPQALSELEDMVQPTMAITSERATLRLCPCCDKGMDTYRYQYTSKVMLDSCSDCGGLWIQDGELAAIRQYLEQERTATAGRRPLTRHRVEIVAVAPRPTPAEPKRLEERAHLLSDFLGLMGEPVPGIAR